MRLLALLICLAIFSAARAQGPANGPAFSFTETKHDFGKVLPDSPLHYTFEFVNSGNAPLFIGTIEPSCHCVSVDWTRGSIAPGAKGQVVVTYAAPIDIGRFDRGLMIASNAVNYDPALMRYELRVFGEGVKELPASVKKAKGLSRTKSRVHKR